MNTSLNIANNTSCTYYALSKTHPAKRERITGQTFLLKFTAGNL